MIFPKIYFLNIHTIINSRVAFIKIFSRIFSRGLSPLYDQKTPYKRGDTEGGCQYVRMGEGVIGGVDNF
jgi:hypothetical protein